jgi:hypothetical protein
MNALNTFPIEHFSQGIIWKKDYEQCTKIMQSEKFLFVSVIGFIDGYMRERFGKNCCDAIYITLGTLDLQILTFKANFPKEILSKKAGKILLCSAPPDAPPFEVYNTVLVEPLLELENGNLSAYVHPMNQRSVLCGTLLALLGDDMALRKTQVSSIHR